VAEERSDDGHEDLDRSDFFLEIFSGDFAIPENPGHESAADSLAAMDRNHGAPAVGVAEEMVTALDSDPLKPEAAKALTN
jgi:hypothetical protein